MTIQEAIEDIREGIKPIVGGKSLEIAIEIMEEVEQYRALGTVEELKNQKHNLSVAYKVIEELQQPKTDWILCEVEMPKDETLMYWTTHEDGSIIMHGYLKRNGFIYNWEVDDLEKRKRQGKVVAWMPIFKPQPYKKEGAEND